MATNIHEWEFFIFRPILSHFVPFCSGFALTPVQPEGEGVRYVSGDIDLPGQGGHKGRPYEG